MTKRRKMRCSDTLKATDRLDIFGTDDPLRLRYDKGVGASNNKEMTSRGFARRMKSYAVEAEIKHFHIHRLRHTFAKIVSEYSESMPEMQEALGRAALKRRRFMCSGSR